MPKPNTLFNYFTKSPAPAKNKSSPTVGDTPEFKEKGNSPKEGAKSAKTSPKSAKQNGGTAAQFQPGDLLWCKLAGYPWWPSLVCHHPTTGTHIKSGKTPMVHVQFFDEPPSRSWISYKMTKPFTEATAKHAGTGGPLFTPNPKVQRGAKNAEAALQLSRENRLELVVDLLPSEDEEDMDVDDIQNGAEEETGSECEEEVVSKKRPSKLRRKKGTKRIRLAVDSGSESEEEEFKPDSEDDDSDVSSGVDENDISEPETESEPESPVKSTRKRKREPAKTPSRGKAKIELSSFSTPSNRPGTPGGSATPGGTVRTPGAHQNTKNKLAMFSAPESPSSEKGSEAKTKFDHETYEFLQEGNIRDAKKRSPSDEDYDPRTLYVPDSFLLKNTTPLMRKWWEVKSQLYDTVLFFKVGKFYELYHMDAMTGVNELGLLFMKGSQAHCGFPEIAYGRYSDTLVQKGYRVARIEQTETVPQSEERIKRMVKPTKFDKVVRREVCRITTKGTKTYSFLEGDTGEAANSYLLAIAEKANEDIAGDQSVYGVCFVDTSIGKFHIGQFEDDRHSSRLRTLIAQYTPSQVLFERGKLSSKTQSILNSNLSTALREALSSSEFWDAPKTLKFLAEKDYFSENEDEEKTGVSCWPEALKNMTSDADSLGLTAADNYDLGVSALGAVIWYLKRCYIDEEMLSMCNFEEYKPLDSQTDVAEKSAPDFTTGKQHMVLDGVTLNNLEIIENSVTGSREGTLLERLDMCCTPFGKRLFKQWLCAPLCNPASINDRLDAVEDLMACRDVVAEVTEILKKVPDLERLLQKIHTLGLVRNKDHPDGRAVFFEDVNYSKKKIADFLSALDGFRSTMRVVRMFKEKVNNFKSKLLKQSVSLDSNKAAQGRFPNLSGHLMYFDHAFDHNAARKNGVIIPKEGVNCAYDEALTDIKSVHRNLDSYRDKQKQRMGCSTISFWSSGKTRYCLEIPESALKRHVPDEYELAGSKKGFKRYTTREIKEMLKTLEEAEGRREAALKDTMRTIFHSFDESYKDWNAAVQCVSVLDVLMSMMQYSLCGDGDMCRPEIVTPNQGTQPFLEIREGRHPCICRTYSGGDFIPNDTVVGTSTAEDMEESGGADASSVVLVTGPNMGGKSTLMRQVGIITIIAQLGCYVPAQSCRLTPIDRVFTRLGASDRIMSGESTFFVELSETSSILQHATPHSLVLLDELGRGTATYDGTAIACSVVKELSENLRCRTLFSTHYHSLVEEFSHDPNVRLGHMACMVENENDEDPSQETITFLYKFVKGACPKSYGFNAARLADLPEEVIRVAQDKAKEFEENMERLKLFRAFNKLCVTKPSAVSEFVSLQNLIKVS
ncbi:DNA mismatch repair protein Msh6-like isoform X1 [Branchiostoma floridae x Branchiostoma belcheri]